MECRAQQRYGKAHGRDWGIDELCVKLQRDGRWYGSHRIADGAPDEADRAEIIAQRPVAMSGHFAVIRRTDRGYQATVRNPPRDVNMAEG